MTRHLAAFGLCLTAALAQPSIDAPRAGCVRDPNGGLRPIHGVFGALLAGAPSASDVVSAACSDSLALVKTTDTVEVRDAALGLVARWGAPPGAALFAFPPDTRTGFAYFPATGQVVQFDAQSAPRTVLDLQSLAGNVLAIASPDPAHLIAVSADGTGARLLRIALAERNIESQTPLEDVAAPLALMNDGTLIFARETSLIIRPPDASLRRFNGPGARRSPGLERGVMPPGGRPLLGERRLPLPAPVFAIDQMGTSWLAVRTADGGAPLGVRFESGRERICRIPAEAAQ